MMFVSGDKLADKCGRLLIIPRHQRFPHLGWKTGRVVLNDDRRNGGIDAYVANALHRLQQGLKTIAIEL